MARAIRAVESPATPVDPLTQGDLGREVEKDREALGHFLELVRVLDERGVLRLAGDFAAANEELVRVGTDWLTRSGTQRAIRNLRVLVEALERIDPDKLERLIGEVGRAVDRGTSVGPSERPLGAFALLRQLGDPDTNRGLRVLLAALKDFGVETARGRVKKS
jgi:uncharacterized protein YjgD (DUF1641 family)